MGAQSILSLSLCKSREELQKQLDMCPSVIGKLRGFVEEFLSENSIFSIETISDEVKAEYHKFVKTSKELTDNQKKYYANSLEPFILHYYLPQYPFVKEQVFNNEAVNKAARNKLATYMMEHNIVSVADINYEFRSMYLMYLKDTIAPRKINEYIKVLDQLKLKSIKNDNENNPLRKHELNYKNEKIFLLYHPNYELAETFYYVRDKEELMFDFSLNASMILKRQIFKMLNNVLKEKLNWHDRRERFLIPLKKLYLFCVENQIVDIEQLRAKEIQAFRESMRGNVGTKENIYIQIIDNTRKYLFCAARETNWNANAWYMERFRLDADRMNPARPIYRITFDEIENLENRKFFKEYMKYSIGLTHEAMITIRCLYYDIAEFLRFCDTEGITLSDITSKNMESYIRYLNDKEIQPEAFNKAVISVFRFLRYLTTKKLIQKVPVFEEYFLKRIFQKHNDRYVSLEIQKMILEKLYLFPEHIRLMYLNLWCTGLRVNEVCTIKAKAYSWDGENAWIKLNQYKMKAEKRVPIPTVLYELMQQYIEINHIKPTEYIFQNRKENAYDAGNFCKQMQKLLINAGISKNEYIFRSHDFRHTVATYLYMHGASIQTIRDYLGHKTEEMSKTYVDWLPKIIEEKNYKYFNEESNDLSCFMKKGGYKNE